MEGKEVAMLQRTERAMIRAMYGVKLMEGKRTEELMDMLGLKESVEMVARANAVRWYGQWSCAAKRGRQCLVRKPDKSCTCLSL